MFGTKEKSQTDKITKKRQRTTPTTTSTATTTVTKFEHPGGSIMSRASTPHELTAVEVLRLIQSELADDPTMLFLQRHQFNLEGKDGAGHTPITMAAAQGKTSTLTHLVERGANITHKQPNKHTALTAAIYCGHFETAAYILSQLGEDKYEFLDHARTIEPLLTQFFEDFLRGDHRGTEAPEGTSQDNLHDE